MRLRLSSRVKSSAVGQLRTVDFFAATFSLYSYNVHHNHIRTHKTVKAMSSCHLGPCSQPAVPNSSHHLLGSLLSLAESASTSGGEHACVAHIVSCATRAQ